MTQRQSEALIQSRERTSDDGVMGWRCIFFPLLSWGRSWNTSHISTAVPQNQRCVQADDITCWSAGRATMMYYTSHSSFYPVFFFFCTCLQSAIASNSPHLSFLCHYSTCFCLLLYKRYLYVCTVIPLALMYPPPFPGGVINKAATPFIYISVTQIPPLAHILTS